MNLDNLNKLIDRVERHEQDHRGIDLVEQCAAVEGIPRSDYESGAALIRDVLEVWEWDIPYRLARMEDAHEALLYLQTAAEIADYGWAVTHEEIVEWETPMHGMGSD